MNLVEYDVEYLFAAIVIISMALVFYTLGVWGERIQRGLRVWHIFAFALGVICDIVGATFMAELVRLTGHDNEVHTITNSVAIFIMAIHAVWAAWTFRYDSKKAKYNFSRFSMGIWYIWLVPYLMGLYLGITAFNG